MDVGKLEVVKRDREKLLLLKISIGTRKNVYDFTFGNAPTDLITRPRRPLILDIAIWMRIAGRSHLISPEKQTRQTILFIPPAAITLTALPRYICQPPLCFFLENFIQQMMRCNTSAVTFFLKFIFLHLHQSITRAERTFKLI